jgi:hypothetical protein
MNVDRWRVTAAVLYQQTPVQMLPRAVQEKACYILMLPGLQEASSQRYFLDALKIANY